MMLVVASRNENKLREIQKLAPDGFNLVSLRKLSITVDAPEEGDSFIQNAISKAIFYGNLLMKPVVADDSGLVVDALGGFPGVLSARFMKDHPYVEKMKTIIKMLKDKEKTARFVCAAAFWNPESKVLLCCEGSVEGIISEDIRGNSGFGYDPFFIPEGFDKTFGELGEEKHKISHRLRAFKQLFENLSKMV